MIFVHGGPQRQMLPGYHYMQFYHWAYAVNQWLASQGYVVMSINYRSGIGYGRKFRTAPNTNSRGNSEYQDVLAGAKYLQARADVDPKRIGIWGLSYGGLLTSQALARNSDIFVAGADLAGVHLSGNTLDTAAVTYQSSTISQIDKWRSPVFLVQGDDDRNVDFAQMVGLVQLLRAHDIYYELTVIPDDLHESLIHSRWIDTFDRMGAFLKRFVWNGETPPVTVSGREEVMPADSPQPSLRRSDHSMTSPAARSSRMLPLLLLLFIGSGCAALIYEIVWFQMLSLIVGSSAISIGVLLGTFMGGMCIGSLLLPRYISASEHPLRVYAMLEAGIAICGVAILFGLPWAGGLYVAIGGGGFGGLLIKGLFCALCLLPPTLLMGATLPAVARWVETTPRGVSWLGFFYGGNIAGAVFGCLLAGFYLLRAHDTMFATFVAVAINVAVAPSGWRWPRRRRTPRR